MAAAGYIYLADPLGLFQTAPVASTPPPKPPEPVADQEEPIPTPEVAPEAAPTESSPALDTAPTPSPALDVAPAEPEPPPPPPPPLPELRNVVSAFQITGARANSSGGMIMIGTTPYKPGEVVDTINRLTFVGFADGVMTFRDERGALYTRRF